MNRRSIGLIVLFLGLSASGLASDRAIEPSNGVDYPDGWQDWATIAVSHRNDNNTMRVILGNDVAVKAARSGETNPWPDGAVLGKVVWKDVTHENWPGATAPGEFVHAEFMFKHSQRYAANRGWAWARWVGLGQRPFDEGMDACIACHTPVKDRDWVFTVPATIPK